ncbi:MAG: GntR family transcriptional regulator [Clostridia bacterium]|nr:GntR family transcriptional regulator [Clostridia bacterium]
MGLNFDNNIPIYIQIVEYLKLQIIRGQLATNQRIPSVRDLSMDLGANPNTIQRALVELEDMGLIYTERTNGKYVTDDLSLIHSIRDTTIHNMIDDFYVSMSRLGLNKEQVLQILNNERNNYGYFTSKEYYKKI